MADFLGTVRATIQKYRMLRPKERVLVGVSGGPDSVALLSALVALREELRLTLRAACVDHGLRPSEVRREIALVKRLGRLWGVPVQIVRRSVRKAGGESLESVAREVRYQVLEGLARRHRCGSIALGHTQDDQAETVLMWLLRGAGTAGLAGMPPVRAVPGTEGVRIIRPLIGCSRAEVEQHLKAQGIRARKDRSNESVRFFRNRIRKELIPLLEQRYNPQIRRHLAQLAEILREDLDWMSRQAKKEFRETARLGPRAIRLNRIRLRRVPAAIRRSILRLAVEQLQGNGQGFSHRHWISLEKLLLNGQHSGGIDLPHRIRAEVGDAQWLRLVAPRSIWYTKR